MIKREMAANIVESLEGALLHLLKAGVVRDEADAEDPTRDQMDLAWLPTTNTSKQIVAIATAFPDLSGPDLPFRTPSEGAGAVPRRLGDADILSMRTHLSQALESLEHAIAALRATRKDEDVAALRWADLNVESVAALQSILQRLSAR